MTCLKPKLSDELIAKIKASTGRVVDVAAQLGVSIRSVSHYRPVRRKHLTDAEKDQVVIEWLAGIPTKETAARLGINRLTIYKVRRRSMAALQGGSNGSA